MTEVQIMLAVANNPRVQAYREAVQIMHRRMTYRYGPDYAVALREDSNSKHTVAGHTRMTPLDSARFASLMRGAAMVRQSVRSAILASA